MYPDSTETTSSAMEGTDLPLLDNSMVFMFRTIIKTVQHKTFPWNTKEPGIHVGKHINLAQWHKKFHFYVTFLNLDYPVLKVQE